MRILILTPYFAPEPFGIAVMTSGLAESLAAQGWKVTVLAGMPKRPDWGIFEEFAGKWFHREMHGAVDVIRTAIYTPRERRSGRISTWRRVLSDSSMGLGPLAVAGLVERPDLILSITPPLQTAAAAIVLKKLWGCPLLNWVQDIVPDAAVSVGMMRDGVALRAAKRLEQFVYRHSDRIGVISEGFAANLRGKGVGEDKLLRLTNWADTSAFDGPDRRSDTRARLGLGSGDFLLLHAGSMGRKQSLDTVVQAMKRLAMHRDIHMVLLGDGICKPQLQTLASSLDIPALRFIDTVAEAAFPSLLGAADLLVLNQAASVVDAVCSE